MNKNKKPLPSTLSADTQKLETIISDFLIGFQRHPEGAGDETDLRRNLFTELYRYFREQEQVREVGKQELDVAYYPTFKSFRIVPVKTVYPQQEKFHIAVLGSEQATSGNVEDRFAQYWNMPVEIGLNLYFAPEESRVEGILRKLKKDRRAMTGYAGQHPDFRASILLMVDGEIEDDWGEPGEYEILPGVQTWLIGTNGVFLHSASS